MTPAIPVLETPRLTLRGHRRDDLAACAAMWGDPLVTRHIGGRALSREEAWTKLLRYVGHWELLGFGYWVVVDKGTGRFAGEVGFANFERELSPALGDTPEAGWVVASWAHGAGFGTEAVRAALVWGDRHLGGTRTVCLVAPQNGPSLRVAEKCGYREVTRTTYKGEATVLLERLRP